MYGVYVWCVSDIHMWTTDLSQYIYIYMNYVNGTERLRYGRLRYGMHSANGTDRLRYGIHSDIGTEQFRYGIRLTLWSEVGQQHGTVAVRNQFG